MAAALTAAFGVMAVTLGACGRKGPLDAPPASGITPPPAYTSRPSIGEESDNLGPRLSDEGQARPSAASAAAPAAATTSAPPPKKTFFLDFLLAK
jgi:predicted small lipoprotein YifL